MKNFENPMGYYCAPNGATPDYVATSKFEDFIAYGLMIGNITGEDRGGCDEFDTYTVRKDFIDYMKYVVENYDEAEPGRKSTGCDSSDGVTIGNSDEGTDESFFNWIFDQRDSDGRLAIIFHWSFMPVVGLGSSDSKTIWLESEALEDKELVQTIFAKAEAAIEQYKSQGKKIEYKGFNISVRTENDGIVLEYGDSDGSYSVDEINFTDEDDAIQYGKKCVDALVVD